MGVDSGKLGPGLVNTEENAMGRRWITVSLAVKIVVVVVERGQDTVRRAVYY